MITTNNHQRLVIDGNQLTDKERAEFDYIDWENDYTEFFRYRGNLYHLGDAMRAEGDTMKGWDGYYGETFWSAVLVRYTPDMEHVVIGYWYE